MWPDSAGLDAADRCVRGWGEGAQAWPSDEDVRRATELLARLRDVTSTPSAQPAPAFVPEEIYAVIREFGGAQAYDSRFRDTIANLAAEVARLRSTIRILTWTR